MSSPPTWPRGPGQPTRAPAAAQSRDLTSSATTTRAADQHEDNAPGHPGDDTRGPEIPAAQLRRRRAASLWCPPLPDGRRDPFDLPVAQPPGWTDRETESWQAAAEHLAAYQLYGRWQTPDSVHLSWRRRICHQGGGAA
jgi:hypothetical protein